MCCFVCAFFFFLLFRMQNWKEKEGRQEVGCVNGWIEGLKSCCIQHLVNVSWINICLAGASSGIPLRGYIQHEVAALVILKRRRWTGPTPLWLFFPQFSVYIKRKGVPRWREPQSTCTITPRQTGASVDAEEFFSFDFFTGIPCINRVDVQHYKL